MQLQLISCGAKRPDRRAIAATLEEIGTDVDSSLATELTGYLLEGTTIDVEVDGGSFSSAARALRKLEIDYEIVEE
ncbi:MAG: hypothetical protein WBA17_11745 [Saprospiraceae bacterium]